MQNKNWAGKNSLKKKPWACVRCNFLRSQAFAWNSDQAGKNPYNKYKFRVVFKVTCLWQGWCWITNSTWIIDSQWLGSPAIILVISLIQLFEMYKPAPSIELIQGQDGSSRKKLFWVSSSRWDPGRKLILPYVDVNLWKCEKVVLKSSKELCDPGKIFCQWDIHPNRSVQFHELNVLGNRVVTRFSKDQ